MFFLCEWCLFVVTIGFSVLFALFLLFVPLSFASVTLTSQLEKELHILSDGLRPIVGHIVSTGQDIVIDLGSNQGIAPGDLFTVYVKNGPVSAPSKKRIYKKVPAGVIKAVEIHTNSTRCAVLVRKRPIPTGSIVERYSGLNVALMASRPDQSPYIEPLRSYLKDILWWLNWSESNVLPSSFKAITELNRFNIDMFFVATEGGIDLYDMTLQKIRHYSLDLGPLFTKKELTNITLKRIEASEFQRIGELYLDAKEARIVDCNHNGIPEVFVLTALGVFAQEYGKGTSRLIEGTSSTIFKKAVSISLSCDRGLLALNREEPGVGLHSSVIDISGVSPLPLCKDVNLWLGFYELSPMGKEVLIAQEPETNKTKGEGAIFVLNDCAKAPTYLKKLTVPREFDLNTGWLWRDYIFYQDTRGEGIIGHLGNDGVDWTCTIKFESIDGFTPQFHLASPMVLEGQPGLIVPGYNSDASISRLYFVSLQTVTGSIFTDPLDGKIIGLGLLGSELYLAMAKDGPEIVLLRASFQGKIGP